MAAEEGNLEKYFNLNKTDKKKLFPPPLPFLIISKG